MEDEGTLVFSYKLKDTLVQLTELVSKLPGIMPDEIKQNSDAALSDLTGQIERSKKILEAYHSELTGFQQKACDLYDDAYDVIKKKKAETDVRMAELANLKEIKCEIPYNFEQLVTMAERLSNLTDDQFQRVLDLARAFGGRE